MEKKNVKDENGEKERNFLEKMREREERQSKDKLSPSNVPMEYYKKKRICRCNKCENCLKVNCKSCRACKDMKKYGGSGTLKLSCLIRPNCLNVFVPTLQKRDKMGRDLAPINSLGTSPATKKIVKEDFSRAGKRTKKERHENIDKLEIQSKKMPKDATKMKLYHGKPRQESQVQKNRLSKAREKSSFLGNDNIGGKENLFEQVTNDGGKRVRNATAFTMTDDNANVTRNTRNNFEINDQTASNTYNNMEQETVAVNIKQENSDYDQEEVEIIKEIAAKTPATIMDIKQDNSDYHQTLISTPTGASAFPCNSQLLSESPTNNKTWHSFHFARRGLTITPVGPSPANSFSTSSEAAETTGRIHYGATKSRGSSLVNNGSGGINETITSLNNSSVNNGLFQNGTTPVGPAATNSFFDSSKADTGRIIDGATISQSKSPISIGSGDISGCAQDGTSISQRKSPSRNRRGDNTGLTQDAARASPSKSPVNNRSGDMIDHMTRGTQVKTAASQSNSADNDRSNTPANDRSNSAANDRSNSQANDRSNSQANDRNNSHANDRSNSVANDRSNSQANDISNIPVNGSGDIPGRAQDGPATSQNKTPVNNASGDIRGHLDEATASPGNSPGNNERRDITECVINEAADQVTRSPENITVTIGGGDLTLKNGELNTQMRDVSMKGPAKELANFVKEATRAVRDLCQEF